MAEVLPRHYIMGIVVFTLMIVGGVSMLGIFAKDDNTYVSDGNYSNFNESFNKITDITTGVENIEESVIKTPDDPGLFGILDTLVQTSWNSLTLMFDSFSFMNDVFSSTNTIFGIPTWVASLVTLLVTILLAFSIWSAIFQRDI